MEVDDVDRGDRMSRYLDLPKLFVVFNELSYILRFCSSPRIKPTASMVEDGGILCTSD